MTIAGGILAALAAGASSLLAASACFTPADNARLGFAVIQQAPPAAPRSRAPYAYYPQSGVTTKQIAALARAGRGTATYYYHWANRSNAPLAGVATPRKLNFQPSMDGRRRQRTAFTSIARANACTLVQAASLLGRADLATRFAAGQGLSVITEAQSPDVGDAGAPDQCITAAGTLPRNATGIVLDYEVQDGRDADTTTRFLLAYAGLVHAAGRQVVLVTNPLDSPMEPRFTGITAAKAHTIVAAFDITALLLWAGNAQHSLAQSYAAQRQIVGPADGRRLMINFELADTTIADARAVRQIILRDRLAGVMLWRNHAVQGGACDSDVNAKIAAIVFGDNKS